MSIIKQKLKLMNHNISNVTMNTVTPHFSTGKKIEKSVEKKINIYIIIWEKLLIDPLTTNWAIYSDSLILRLLGKRKCSYKNNRKELQNSVSHLATQSFWNQLMQELTNKTACNKAQISPVEKDTFFWVRKV